MAKGWEYVFMLGEDNLSIFQYNNFPTNGYVPNIKTWFKKDYFAEHHATFTKEMCLYFIEYFTKQDDLVLDPFSGSGTTGVACAQLGRRFLGFEIDANYCHLANDRIAAAHRGQTLTQYRQGQEILDFGGI
jgi:DNA modification methylase